MSSDEAVNELGNKEPTALRSVSLGDKRRIKERAPGKNETKRSKSKNSALRFSKQNVTVPPNALFRDPQTRNGRKPHTIKTSQWRLDATAPLTNAIYNAMRQCFPDFK